MFSVGMEKIHWPEMSQKQNIFKWLPGESNPQLLNW